MLTAIAFDSGDRLERDALFFSTGQHPQSELAIRLGCALTRRGTVKTGMLCDTNVPRVFVAGDASRDAQFVVVAAAEGVKAAVAINTALQSEELAK
jgi:thioredoxin reductase